VNAKPPIPARQAIELPDLLTAEQVAKKLAVSVTAVRDLCDSGKLPHYRIGTGKKKRYRISPAGLAKYLEGAAGEAPESAARPATVAASKRPRRSRMAALDDGEFLRACGWNGG